MKHVLIIFLILSMGQQAVSQKKVSEKDLDGIWEMVFDLDEETWNEDLEDESFFERIIARSVSGLVFNILDDLKIQFEFLNNNELRLTVEIWDEKEIEYSKWRINRNGELLIGDDWDDDEIWLFEGDKLVSFQKKRSGTLKEKNIYLERIN